MSQPHAELLSRPAESQPAPALKRPRGRPRKHPPKDPALPKRKRGRPPKVSRSHELQGERSPADPSPPKRQPGRPPKDSTLPKRKPGRPPKDASLPKRKPGRPPKNLSVAGRKPGRPLGSKRKKSESPALPSSLEPRVLLVPRGEDIAARVFLLSREEGKAVCVLSANGSVHSPTLTGPGDAFTSTNHEGPFDLLSLSGSYVPDDPSDAGSRMGGLSATMVGGDGLVHGGGVASPLLAFTTVQVMVLLFPTAPMGA
ncbi:hypothetical protein CLOM_g16339 [Closterium sp. NIES-68]|nr:hypothetical protein CLOM_g22226 [Closterium sp. NIES-68]GJP57315.1 hypothetical protein CLOM_g16339 [Closterium sp. NIES-68]GJP75352.1 hypothetical protein CLOP_g5809 [Closterium sp. NIES-67]GJP83585.1 hypothetical protein CLOP_g13719 [Closterium sp. NIES-67]